ncbi:hypothetical protein AMTRI_Chr03g54340 [Amborella trichopoda]
MAAPILPSDPSAALAVRDKVQKLLSAACTGNLDLFKKLAAQLDEGKELLAKTIADVKDANGRGALHFAAREGKTEICKYLLELGLSIDPKDDYGETPLVHAARQGHLTTAKYLLEHGADPTTTSHELGATSLHHAAGTGCNELLSILLSKGVDVDTPSDAGTPLIWAAGNCKQGTVKTLLEYHANPNAETEDNITPLLSAVAAGSLESLELLVQAGANPNASAGGATSLHIAADGVDVRITNCLLKAGADPNAIDEDGLKPIQVAAGRGNREAVEALFPLTSSIPGISKWSIEGIIAHTESQAANEPRELETSERSEMSMEANSQKQEMIEVSPEAKKKSLEAKSRGEDAFKNKDYLLAVYAYTQAIDLDPSNAALLSNRSLCWIRLGQAEQALVDAKACRESKPDWPKACYREGAALRLLQRFDEAASAFYEGVRLDPENKELVNAFREAVEAGRKFHSTEKLKSEQEQVQSQL